jgi:hypothetical protein
VFLTNIKIADYNIATVTAERIQELMTRMRDLVLIPMASIVTTRNDTKRDFIVSFLLLTTSFCDVQLLLKMYAKKSGSQSSLDVAEVNKALLAVDSNVDSTIKYYSVSHDIWFRLSDFH